MIKSIVTAAALSLMLVTAGWALPATSTVKQLPQPAACDLVEVGQKGHGHKGHGHKGHKHKGHGHKNGHKHGHKHKHGKHKHWKHDHHGHHWHGGKRYKYRYAYRPYNWAARGCIATPSGWFCLW
jgi:hypothetical protein